jgi:chromosome segregation ATPase
MEGDDEKTALYKGYLRASSKEILDELKAVGVSIQNEFDTQANPHKLTGLELGNDKARADIAQTQTQTKKTIADIEYVKRRTSLLGQELALKIQNHELARDKFLNDLSGKSIKEKADKEKEIRGLRNDLSKKAEDYRRELRGLQSKLASLSDSKSETSAQREELKKQIAELTKKVSDIQQEYQGLSVDLDMIKDPKGYENADPVSIDPSLKGRIGR